MVTAISRAQNPKVMAKVRATLEAGKLAEMLAIQGSAAERGGEMQILTLLAAEQIISVELDWRWSATNYDVMVNELKGKYERYGARLNPLSERQLAWAASFLGEEYRRARARQLAIQG